MQKSLAIKSDAINFLIKKARLQEEFYDFVRAKIDKGEKSGFVKKQTREEMLAEFKTDLGDVKLIFK
ncbi:CopG family transcriptional regulator [Flavobacterium sp. LM4]|uniref:CopG family transcriptional regulator n=1 Tax=Flavobacterium sp. LM4 TaxID=1938609 RepID=UPI001CB989F5|nr:CopG family transcriptional regulator [Flavobacterium sp. LM4]